MVVCMVEENFRQKERERELLRKSINLVCRNIFVSIIRTYRKDCPFVLSLRATDDGKGLRVTRFSDDHNHEISKVIASFF